LYIGFNIFANATAFYILLFLILPNFNKDTNRYKLSFYVIINICSIILFKEWIYTIIPVAEGDITLSLNFTTRFLAQIWEVGITIPFALAFWYADKIVKEKEEQYRIEQENFLLEQAIIDTQINNLKNQINPDFLFRKLDYFYKESLPYSANLSKGISLLKEMMKYAIDDDGKNGKVSLQKEIRHIQNFIEINQLRFDGRLQIFFEASGVSEKHQIMPLVLITFVENAFKYGELLDKNSPVTINLEMRSDEMFFSTFNKIRLGPTEESEGIGITNTEKRLSLAYPNNYWLNIHHQHPHYEMKLYLNLAYSE
jgi:two-component system, LytTR family, sensor kinase